MTSDHLPQLTPEDDLFHGQPGDDLFVTETRWFGFAVPERRLAGVLYPVVRPNQSICSLGVHLWHIPMPPDLRDFELLGGFSHRCLDPLQTYEVSYDDGVELRLHLRYQGLHDPVGRGHGGPVSGFTQICRVTGTISLNGDDLRVDCHELRAGFWGSRSDFRFPPLLTEPEHRANYSDTYAASARSAFLIGTAGQEPTTTAHSGYLLRDGDLQPIVEGTRTVTRRSSQGVVEELEVDAVDAAGRTLHAVGTCVNHLFMQSTPSIGLWNNATRWTVDGERMWGQDQDVPGGRPARHPHPRPADSAPAPVGA
ncbi:DUF7064 domain-containing protein [Frankia gtarii]|uniref:DUF7064 domain-containing protein n=1 Tax=Frankia gtarii TaxID=2950102 RepID=UPI0021BF9811|nr:hypothetical protein [Frankia gtarii]